MEKRNQEEEEQILEAKKKRWGEAECDGQRRESQRELKRGEGTRAALQFFYFLLPSGEPSLIYPRCNCIHLTQHISIQWAGCTHTHAVALTHTHTHTHTPLGSYLAVLQPAYNSSALSLTQPLKQHYATFFLFKITASISCWWHRVLYQCRPPSLVSVTSVRGSQR